MPSFLKYLFLLLVVSTPCFARQEAMITLDPTDYVGISFWTISMAMIASTVFFLMESLRMPSKWRTSLVIGGLVTLVAGVHYFYMRDVWVLYQTTPIVFRYVDWIITVPLQMIEFYFILIAATSVSFWIFWRLLLGSVVMLLAGYLGEIGAVDPWGGFVVGMLAWFFIIYEIFLGEAARSASTHGDKTLNTAFHAMRLIVTIGWAIYPLGYVVGYLVPVVNDEALNIIYNIADFVNKIAFVAVIWVAADKQLKQETASLT